MAAKLRFAGWDARSEERRVVVPLKRRATQQIGRKGASRRVSPHCPTAMLLALRMGNTIRGGSWSIMR